MIDIIAIVGVWLISLVSSFVSIIQPKGIDWYAPISGKQKMIMTFINISIALLVMILSFLAISGYLWKIIVISSVCIIIILYFSFPQFLKKLKKKSHVPDPITKAPDDEKDTLIDIFSKILTVFNSIFLLMNIAYMLYAYENIKSIIEDNDNVITTIFTNNSIFIIHGTILFWTTISAIVITKSGWEYDIEINSNYSEKKRKKHDATFFSKRITDRNG